MCVGGGGVVKQDEEDSVRLPEVRRLQRSLVVGWVMVIWCYQLGLEVVRLGESQGKFGWW